MITAGKILKQARLDKNLTLEEVAEITKIKKDFIQALEEGYYENLPGPVYIKGLARNYAQALGVDVEKVWAFFRREYKEEKTVAKVPPQPIDRPFLTLTPARLFTLLASVAIFVFLAILFWQYRSFAGAPVLVISSPNDQVTIDRPFVNVVGRTDHQAKVTINGEEVLVSEGGFFERLLNLSGGLNTIRVVAQNSVGKETVVERVVEVKSD